jgi:hypothetical protein
MSWKSKRREYVKATAPVETWNKLFSTDFFYFKDEHPLSRLGDDHLVLRARSYEMPDELVGHVDTIFNTVQPVPIISKKLHMPAQHPYRLDHRIVGLAKSNVDDTTPLQDDDGHLVTTIAYLNAFYDIPTNQASSSTNLGQSVFETDSMSFSEADLLQFQTIFNLTQQEALDIGGQSVPSTTCSFDGCGEGSLDIQYIMGISQTTVSTYYYVGTADPFVTWVTDLANDSDPPKSNSMSWGSIEQVGARKVMNGHV